MAINDFNSNAILNEIRCLFTDINNDFVPGSLEWAKENRPQIIGEIRKTRSLINRNYIARDVGAVRNAISRHKAIHANLFQLYRNQTTMRS